MSAMASQITGVLIVCSIVCSGADQRKHQSPTSLAFVKGIYRWPVDSTHKGPSKAENGSMTKSRRKSRSRCAWLTGPEPRWGYARTSFGVDAATEVTISKCNLWKSWTVQLTSEFSHAHLTIFSIVWVTGWFYQDHPCRRNAKTQNISIVTEKWREKKQHFKESLIDSISEK